MDHPSDIQARIRERLSHAPQQQDCCRKPRKSGVEWVFLGLVALAVLVCWWGW